MIEADSIRIANQRKALDDWLSNQKRRMSLRFPLIDFESNNWPIRTLYQTVQSDWNFNKSFEDFSSKDVSYRDALRCFVAEMVIAGKPKAFDVAIPPYRLLARTTAYSLLNLTLKDLRHLEAECLNDARKKLASAKRIGTKLSVLESSFISKLADKGIIPRLGFRVHAEVKSELRKIAITHEKKRNSGSSDVLDRKMEAFNEAFNALVTNPLNRDGSPILSNMDRVAICASVILMCAPSRINEPLCMSIDDYITIDDYTNVESAKADSLHDVHKMLLMKGSKGAQWAARPVLHFMIEALDYCMNVVRDHGKRSRTIVEWYQKNPRELYLPPELEYLRGQIVTRYRLALIINLTSDPTRSERDGTARLYFQALSHRVFRGPNPDQATKCGNKTSRPITELLLWTDIEEFLLEKVRDAMAMCRRVSHLNHYEGDLSKMLFLFDGEELRFRPQAMRYGLLRARLKKTETERQLFKAPTLFEKLNITMPVNGKIQIGEIDTHDPRRWLTTQALIHSDNLSNVLINKWANRLSLYQLKCYDKRDPAFRASQAAMPEAPRLTELTDLSNGLTAIDKLQDEFGLSTSIVTAHDVGIAMTSMDAVTQAIEDRPVAKSSRGIIIIYPQRFGVCFHQHHEKPCRNYSNDLVSSCITCHEGAFVKGHLPTNHETRKIANQLYSSVLRHLERLAMSHNRRIADDPEKLGEHMLTLVESGLDRAAMELLAKDLIGNFHQIDTLLKDRQLARRLQQAFVAQEVVKTLDDQTVSNGALIKYHNPTQHSEPLLEIALDEYGGRKQVALDEQALISRHPQFSPRALGLSDERHLIEPDNEHEER